MADLYKNRRDTAANWAAANPVLAAGEIGIDTTNGGFRVGDGVTAWRNLRPVRGADLRHWAPPWATSIDEFDDNVLDPAWARVDGAGVEASRLTWVEGINGALAAINTGGDGNEKVHGLVRPIGTALADGTAFETFMQSRGGSSQYSMTGIVLSEGAQFGSGTQVYMLCWGNGTNLEGWRGSGWNGATSLMTGYGGPLAVGPAYYRLVYVSANTFKIGISPDGVNWTYSSTFTQTCTPTHVGFLSSSWAGTHQHVASYEYLRRINP